MWNQSTHMIVCLAEPMRAPAISHAGAMRRSSNGLAEQPLSAESHLCQMKRACSSNGLREHCSSMPPWGDPVFGRRHVGDEHVGGPVAHARPVVWSRIWTAEHPGAWQVSDRPTKCTAQALTWILLSKVLHPTVKMAH